MSQLVVVLKNIVTNVIGKLPSTFSNAAKSSVKSINTATKTRASANVVKPTTIASLVGSAYSVAWSIVSGIVFCLIIYLLPTIFKYVKRACRGLNTVLENWLESIHATSGQKWWWSIFVIVFRFIPFTIAAFYTYVLRPIIKNFALIIVTCVLIILFTFINRHFHEMIMLFTNVEAIFYDGLNLLGTCWQISVEIINVFLPITNMIERHGVMNVIALYDGIVYSIETFGRRTLDELGAEAIFESIKPTITIWQLVDNVFLSVENVVISILFKSGLIYALGYIVDFIAVITTKGVCMLANIPCAIREVIDAWVFDYLIDKILNNILSIFGQVIPLTHDIACPTAILIQGHITSACYGGILSWEPAGPFRNAPRSGSFGRRNTIECVQKSGKWYELINDKQTKPAHTSIHHACSFTKQAFTPFGNTINLEHLDEHNCYELCVHQILVEVCSTHTKRYLGSCGFTNKSLVYKEARRKLDSLFNINSQLAPILDFNHDAQRTTRIGAIDSLTTFLQPLQFNAPFGDCDLTQSSLFSIPLFYDLLCMATKLSEKIKIGESPTPRHLIHVDTISSLRHLSRKTKYAENAHDSPIAQLIDAINQTQHQMHLHLHTAKGRHLSSTEPCPGELLCPNGFQCVENEGDDPYLPCLVKDNVGFVPWVRYYLVYAQRYIVQFNIKTSIYNIFACWRFIIDNPEYDRYHSSNLRIENPAEHQFKYCFPMIEPGPVTFTKWDSSLKDTIYSWCSALSSSFLDCYCPMYYDLSGQTLHYSEYVSTNLVYMVLNGLIFIKNTFVFFFGDGVGYVWSSLFPATIVSHDISNSLSLYSHEISWEVYWICNLLQCGSVLLLVLIVWTVSVMCSFIFAIMDFIVSGGLLKFEKNRAVKQHDV